MTVAILLSIFGALLIMHSRLFSASPLHPYSQYEAAGGILAVCFGAATGFMSGGVIGGFACLAIVAIILVAIDHFRHYVLPPSTPPRKP